MSSIVHFIDSVDEWVGGPARSVPALIAGMSDLEQASHISNYTYHLLSSSYRQNTIFASTGLPEGTHFHSHEPTRIAALLGKTSALERTASLIMNVALVHDHGLWLPNNHAAARFAMNRNIPLVISPRGMLTRWAVQFKGIKKQLAWYAYQRSTTSRAALIHATSEEEACDIRSLGIRQPIALIPNGVEVTGPRAQHLSDRKTRVALFMSRIHPKKGVDLLLQAWARLKPRDWILRIVGPDELGYRRQMETLASKLNISGIVEFVSAVAEPYKWVEYENADLFVLPTHSENFGIAVAEALGKGLPVITTNKTPWLELDSKGCGWCIQVSIEQLAEALHKATLLQVNERKYMGEIGSKWIEEQFGWRGVANDMKAAYQYVLTKSEPPSCVVMD